MKKKLSCLAAILVLCSFIAACYLFYLSPDRGYYKTRFGLMEGKPFRIHGKVVDQYGQPVEGYKMVLRTFFEEHAASVAHTKVGPFMVRADRDGKFSLDTSPVKVNGVFYESKEQDNYIDGVYYHHSLCSGGDIFSLYHDRWIRDGRWETSGPALNVPHDESKEYIYHVGRSGSPQRMIQFTKDLKWAAGAFTDSLWVSVDILKGELKEGRYAECDIQLRVEGLAQLWEEPRKEGLRYEFTAGKGAGVQLQGDLFGCEAPPGGYEERVVTQPVKRDGNLWAVGWASKPSGGYPFSPQIYFISHEGQVYGSATLNIQPSHNPRDLRIEVQCVANPRGQRNLNGGIGSPARSAIPLPVTLPFKEDVPLTDWRKIWAYADPSKENTLIVEGEKGAVEPGAGFTVMNHGLRGTDYTRAAGNGAFSVSLRGEEGDPLEIHIGWPGGLSPKTGKKVAQDEGVVLAPRWRLRGNGKP